jgi:hypothetical protein
MRRNELCPGIVEDDEGGGCEGLFKDRAGKIRMSGGEFDGEIGAETIADENDGGCRNVPRCGEVGDGRIGVLAPPRFTGVSKVALPISAIIEGEDVEAGVM